MKTWGLGLFAFSFLFTQVSVQATPTDDIFLQTRSDQVSTTWLLDKTAGVLTNLKLGPGIHGETTLDRDWYFTAEELEATPEFAKIQGMLAQVFHANMKNAQLRIRIPKLSYDITTVIAKAVSLTSMDPFLNLYSEVSLTDGTTIGLTSGIQLDLVIPNIETNELESYLTANVEPLSVTIPKSSGPAKFSIGYQAIRGEKMQFNLGVTDLSPLPKFVRDQQKNLIIKVNRTQAMLDVNNIKINPVIVRLGRLTRTLNFDDFKPLVQSKLNDIIGKVIPAVGDGLKTSIGPRILESINTYSTRSDFQFSNDKIFARYSFGKFSNPTKEQIAFSIDGQSCTADAYKELKLGCVAQNQNYTPARVVSDDDHAKAKAEVTDKLARNEAISAMSISEEYLNRLLKTTIDAKLWDKTLDEDNLYLGEKGAFFVFNKDTREPELILDLYYYGDGSRLQRLVVNENKPIHFPLRLSLSANFALKNDSPFLVFKTKEVTSTTEEIINGLDEYGIQSHLVWGFKNKIANMILTMAGEMEEKTALEMEIPVLKGIGIDKSWFEVSPYGRINLYIKP